MPRIEKNNRNNKKKLTPECIKMLNDFEIIKALHEKFKEHGRLLESTFDALGIPKDEFDGNDDANKTC